MQLESRHFSKGHWNASLPVGFDGPDTLVLAFAAPEFMDQPQPLHELAAAFPQAVIVGCSTSGEIVGSEVRDASISVAIARFEHTALRHASTPIAQSADSFAAGQRLAQQLTGPDLRAVFVLSDGLGVNGTPLVDALTRELGAGVLITGGLAGDGSRFARTWVLDQGQPKTHTICAVGLYGTRLNVGHGCDGGWSDFGPERRITRAEGNVLFELDGKPALELYKSYLGERAAGLPGTALLFPLAVKRDSSDQDTLVRTILAIDESRQSLTFAGDLPQGGVARLMRANTDKIIGSAGLAGAQARAGHAGSSAALAVSVSCVGRRLVLGERTDEEVETVCDAMPMQAAHVGFYSYGEISPAARGGMSELHNQTMTVTVFSEG
ncbi:MAG: FIST C-terminal domain-containing protein [Rubrivivax sp.]|nr:FIST C-terminal domain-containing protein [Rubrivivax sp.]